MAVAELIACCLVFLAYTHGYYYPETWPVCVLAATVVIALYCGWRCVRAGVVCWVMEQAEAAKEVCRRVARAVEGWYDDIAEAAFVFGEDFERLCLAIESAPHWSKWAFLCLTIGVEWALFMARAWVLEDEDTMLKLVAWASGGMFLLLICLNFAADAREKGKEKERVASQALIVCAPIASSESRKDRDRRERQKKQAERFAAYRRQDEEYDKDNSQTDAFGNLSLSVIAKRSPRSADPGVHQPKPIEFPEDRAPAPAPKPQPTYQYPPAPKPEPESKPIDWHEYEHARRDWQIITGELFLTPLSCAGNCPWEKKSTGPGAAAPKIGLMPEPNGVEKASTESTSGQDHGTSKDGQSSRSTGGNSQQGRGMPGGGPSASTGGTPAPDGQGPQVPPLQPPPGGPSTGSNKPEEPKKQPSGEHEKRKPPHEQFRQLHPTGYTTSYHYNYQELFIATGKAPTLAFGNYRGAAIPKSAAAATATGSTFNAPPGVFGAKKPTPTPATTQSPAKNTGTGGATPQSGSATSAAGFGAPKPSPFSGASGIASNGPGPFRPKNNAQSGTGLPGLFTTGNTPTLGSASDAKQPAGGASCGASKAPSGFGGASTTPGSTLNPIWSGLSNEQNREAVKNMLRRFMSSFVHFIPNPPVFDKQRPWKSMSPAADENAFKVESQDLADTVKRIFDWVHPEGSQGWDKSRIDCDSVDDCYMGAATGNQLWHLQGALNTLYKEHPTCLELENAVGELKRLRELYKTAFPPPTRQTTAPGGGSKPNGPGGSGAGGDGTPQKSNPFASSQNDGNAEKSNQQSGQQGPFTGSLNGNNAHRPAGNAGASSQPGSFKSDFNSAADSFKPSSTTGFGQIPFVPSGDEATGAKGGKAAGGKGGNTGQQRPWADTKPTPTFASGSNAQPPDENPLMSLADATSQRAMVNDWTERMQNSFVRAGKKSVKKMTGPEKTEEVNRTTQRLQWMNEWCAPGDNWDVTRIRSIGDAHNVIGTSEQLNHLWDGVYCTSAASDRERQKCLDALDVMTERLKVRGWLTN